MSRRLRSSRVFASTTWQMSLGERAALTGLLAELTPRLSLEIGIGTGGSLPVIASYSAEVHAFDLDRPVGLSLERARVTFHIGDSHTLLPRVLEDLKGRGTPVDFALVDGDHSAEGVRKDIEDLLRADAVADCAILVHDTMNPEVRRGIEAVQFDAHSKVRYVDLEFLPGYLAQEGPFSGQLWGGFALILTTSTDEPALHHLGRRQTSFFPLFKLASETTSCPP